MLKVFLMLIVGVAIPMIVMPRDVSIVHFWESVAISTILAFVLFTFLPSLTLYIQEPELSKSHDYIVIDLVSAALAATVALITTTVVFARRPKSRK